LGNANLENFLGRGRGNQSVLYQPHSTGAACLVVGHVIRTVDATATHYHSESVQAAFY
jgi:hypothetical protein